MTDGLRNRVEASGLSDVGRRRRHNEDSFRIEPDLGLLLVADGMGGHDLGEVASAAAVDAITAALRDAAPGADGDAAAAVDRLREAVIGANRAIFDENRKQGYAEGSGMGTTVAGIWLPPFGNHGAVFHVGDSRVYRLRDGELGLLTRDHTLYQEWLDSGSQGDEPRRNIILRALGPWSEVEVDVILHPMLAGDLYLICSDGLNSMVDDPAIAETLTAHGDRDLAEACAELVARANEAGGHDNVTVILARCR